MNTCTRGFYLHACRLVAPLVVAGIIAGSGMPTASAQTISTKQAQARALADQIDALGRKEAALAEHYNAAVLQTQATAAKVRQQQSAMAAALDASGKARGALLVNAVDAYVHGGTLISRASRNGGTAQADGGLLAGEYVNTLAATQSEALDNFRSAAVTAKEAAAKLSVAEHQQAQAASVTNAARNATIASQHQLDGALSKVKGEIVTLVAEAQAAKQAAAAAAAQALLAQARALTSGSGGGGSVLSSSFSNNVPVGAGAGAAVAAAMSRMGAPYVWGATGPGEFDCSGLTMWAWAHAGVNLPHFSGAQYASTAHISMAQLQPGDLVFPSNPGDHVAMYVGGGNIVEAPHSGAVVHVRPMDSWFVLASRP